MVEQMDGEPWEDFLTRLNTEPISEPVRTPVVRIGERQPIPYEIRQAVRRRDDNRCVVCHWSPDVDPSETRHLEIDHIFPWSAGGSDKSDNLRTLCNSCNAKRSNWTTDHAYTRPSTPVVVECYPCRLDHPVDRPNEGSISVYCANGNHRSWTTAAYPPL